MIIFRIMMPMLILFMAIVSYRLLWVKYIKPVLDKEKMDDIESKNQQRQKQSGNGGSEQHDTKA